MATAQSYRQALTRPLEEWPAKPGYLPGSFRFDSYFGFLSGKRVGLVVNHTASWKGVHLVDTLRKQGVEVIRIFAPEHGFRGTAEAGEFVVSGVDSKTGIPVVSLYGKVKKPTPEMLADLDVVLFDIQDVGARFYTYISTLKGVMEACASSHKTLLVADRANPLGFCYGGPVLDPAFSSFVGAFPIPVVHGLTVGELAKMAKKEHWFPHSRKLKLKVIPCLGYRHRDTIFPEIPPSPNLTTPLSILAYPSLCLFEGTRWSVGRGTLFPFQVFGFPDSTVNSFRFRPERMIKTGPAPLHEGNWCYGWRVSPDSLPDCFSLKPLLKARLARRDSSFFNPFFSKLLGSDQWTASLDRGEEVQFDLRQWADRRKRNLLYPE